MNSTIGIRRSLLRDIRCLVVEHNPDVLDRMRIARHELKSLLPRHVLARQAKRLGQMTVAEIAAVKAQLRQMLDQMLAVDMAWTPYQKWVTNESKTLLIDAVGRRLLKSSDVRQAIDTVRQRSAARKSYL